MVFSFLRHAVQHRNEVLSDENFPLASVNLLEREGLEIVSITILSPGVTDQLVLRRAVDEARVLLTLDRDFGELIFRKSYTSPPGIILFRLNSFEPETPGRVLLDVLKVGQIHLEGMMTVISENSIRQKKL